MNMLNREEHSLEDSQDNKSIVVVCASDNNYSMPLAVTMRSALENLQDTYKIIFYVIDGGISRFNKRKILQSLIPEKCEVKFIQISTSLIDTLTESHKPMESKSVTTRLDYISIASFYRLLIPDLLPNQIEKVIYLDCDLVIKGNLLHLWGIDLGENYVLAVRDTWIPNISSPTSSLNYTALGLEPDLQYFNAGVLVINLKKWRDEGFSDKALKYFRQNINHIGYYDQGLLNALLVKQWGALDPRWNVNVTSYFTDSSGSYLSWKDSGSFLSEDIYSEVVTQPYILHYISNIKPWNSWHCRQKEEFFKYVDMTAWSGWRLRIWKRLWLRVVLELKKLLSKFGLP